MNLFLQTIQHNPALLIEPGIAFFVTLAIAYVLRALFFAAARKTAARTNRRPVTILIESLRGPTHIWNLILALHFAIQASALPPKATEMAPQILQVLFIASLTLMCMRFASETVRYYGHQMAGSGAAPVTSLTQNLAELIVLIIGALVLLNALNVKVTPILTALGVGGLAVALALQDTLSNLFAGFYISVSGQMRLGDYIKLNSGEEGYLTDIGWRSTAIKAGLNNLIIVPNAKLAQAIVTNYSLPDKRVGASLQIMTDFESDPERIERILLEEAKSGLTEIEGMADAQPSVVLEPSGDWSFVFTIGFQVTEFSKQGGVKHALRKRVIKRFRAEGIPIPMPARAVYLHSATSDSPSSKSDAQSPSTNNPSKRA